MRRFFRIIHIKVKRYWHWYNLQWVKIEKFNRENGYW